MKYVIVHADGISDVPRPELENKTPLEFAVTSNLDRIAQSGELGLLACPGDGRHVGSETTAMAVLGYDPRKYYTGPGPLEAASLGVSVGEQDVVFCCTMITLSTDAATTGADRDFDVKKLGPHLLMEDATAGGIETEQARELIDQMNEQLGSETIQFYPGSGHRHLMVWVGGKARTACVNPDQVVGRAIGDSLPNGDGADMLRKLMDASIAVLRDHPVNEERRVEGQHPANCLWLWGQGKASEWPPLTERHPVSGAVITGSDVHRGVGISAGLASVDMLSGGAAEGASYESYREAVARELERHDLLYVHAGLPPSLRRQDAKQKVQALEEFDQSFVGPLLQNIEKYQSFRLLVICDPSQVMAPDHPQAPLLYAYGEGPLRVRSAGRRLHEAEAFGSGVVPREATKLLAKFLAGAG